MVVDALDKSWYAGPIVRPELITVDPRRDSAPKMKDYIKQFHPRFIGLTGSEEQVRKVTKAYRVYFNPTNDDDENYLVSGCHIPDERLCPCEPLSCSIAGSLPRTPAHQFSKRCCLLPLGGSFHHRLPSQSRRRIRGLLRPGRAGSDNDSEGGDTDLGIPQAGLLAVSGLAVRKRATQLLGGNMSMRLLRHRFE